MFAASVSLRINNQEEVFAPAIVQVLVDTFPAAELGDGMIALYAFENYADLFFSGVFPSGLVVDVGNSCFSRCFLRHDEFLQIDGKASLNSKLQFV